MTAFEWIEQIRQNKGLNIKAFMEMINYEKSNFQAWKKGISPGKNAITAIEKAFGVSAPLPFDAPKKLPEPDPFDFDLFESKHRKWVYLPDIHPVCPLDHCEWVSPDGKCHLPACLKGVKSNGNHGK